MTDFVDYIAEHADEGDVIAGTRSLRTIRWARPGTGKRGAPQVVNFVRTAAGEVVLVVAYAKGTVDKHPAAYLRRLRHLYDV